VRESKETHETIANDAEEVQKSRTRGCKTHYFFSAISLEEDGAERSENPNIKKNSKQEGFGAVGVTVGRITKVTLVSPRN